SFGATTLQSRHVHDEGRKVRMRFTGKYGKTREVTITDRTLGRVVRQCDELPGQALFQYLNGDGHPHPITSDDVNAYIRENMGDEFTAKHFRTWAASVIAFDKLREASEEHRKISVGTMVEPVAEALIAALLILRWLGRRACDRDPEGHTWKAVIGRALARTNLAFMIVAAADSLSTYANLPHPLARVIDIAFVIAFALQGAIWARELFLGMIARRVVDAEGGSSLVN